MKNVFVSFVSALVMSSAFASSFTVSSSESAYYYAGNASQAAEAKVWREAIQKCQKSGTDSNVLPIRISDLTFQNEDAYTVSVSAKFKCLDAEGREL